jgi:hypothetical protein
VANSGRAPGSGVVTPVVEVKFKLVPDVRVMRIVVVSEYGAAIVVIVWGALVLVKGPTNVITGLKVVLKGWSETSETKKVKVSALALLVSLTEPVTLVSNKRLGDGIGELKSIGNKFNVVVSVALPTFIAVKLVTTLAKLAVPGELDVVVSPVIIMHEDPEQVVAFAPDAVTSAPQTKAPTNAKTTLLRAI